MCSCQEAAFAAEEETREAVLEYCNTLAKDLRSRSYDGRPVRVELDLRDLRGGEKSWQWMKGGFVDKQLVL